MQNQYCMFKGTLLCAAPFNDVYSGSPHYVITVTSDGATPFNIVVNAASTQAGVNGNDDVYQYVDPHFTDTINQKLGSLNLGLYQKNFPKLDYWQDTSLLDLHRMRPIPYETDDGSRFDVNDVINDLLSIDETQPSMSIGFNNGHTTSPRNFWKPTVSGIIVYGFGFLFPTKDGLHETHMNQGNPVKGGHANENGAFQDGAVIVQRDNAFSAIFTAFQTQYVPTDARGFPTPNAKALPDFISQ